MELFQGLGYFTSLSWRTKTILGDAKRREAGDHQGIEHFCLSNGLGLRDTSCRLCTFVIRRDKALGTHTGVPYLFLIFPPSTRDLAISPEDPVPCLIQPSSRHGLHLCSTLPSNQHEALGICTFPSQQRSVLCGTRECTTLLLGKRGRGSCPSQQNPVMVEKTTETSKPCTQISPRTDIPQQLNSFARACT